METMDPKYKAWLEQAKKNPTRCPKCGQTDLIVLNPSNPAIYECKNKVCKHRFNPLNERFTKQVPADQAVQIDPREPFIDQGIVMANGKRRLKLAVRVATVEFLTGKDYPRVCPACQQAIDRCVELVREGEDTNDIEAPLNFAGDHNLLCGGRFCKARKEKEPDLCLRIVTPTLDGPIFSQPSVAKGNGKSLHDFATKRGWKAIADNTMFHFHYVDDKGNEYYLDLA